MMPPDSPYSGWTGTPPFVRSFLHTLNQMRARETLLPAQLAESARALLTDRLGVTPEPAESVFAHAPLGVLSEHARFFDGFALMLLLAQGLGVAVRRSEAPRLVVEASRQVWTLSEGDEGPPAVQFARALQRHLAPGTGADVALAGTAPEGEAALAALGIAMARAMQALLATAHAPEAQLRQVAAAAERVPGIMVSRAHLIAAQASRSSAAPLVLVDVATGEYMGVEGAPPDTLGWAYVDLGAALSPDFYEKRQAQARAALKALRARGFRHLASLRDLEHRDLQSALGVLLRPSHRAIVRYLVTENARVQRLVAAVRRKDGQMLGALLLMSHAARKADFGAASAEADFVVEQIETMSLDGMYGASAVAGGQGVLVVGQPFVVPQAMERLHEAFAERFANPLAYTLL